MIIRKFKNFDMFPIENCIALYFDVTRQANSEQTRVFMIPVGVWCQPIKYTTDSHHY